MDMSDGTRDNLCKDACRLYISQGKMIRMKQEQNTHQYNLGTVSGPRLLESDPDHFIITIF